MTFRATILKTLIDYHLWDFQSRLILAVSGGCDSMAMFHVLRLLAPNPTHQLVTAHIDHAVRKESADDAEFVEQTSIAAGIPFICIRLKNPDPPQGVSAEQYWRTERYKILHNIRTKTSAVAIATAHTATDHIETILMRLVTGAGPRGFLGIRLARTDGIIRPLLHVTRDEVKAFTDRHAIRWTEDISNKDISRPRNAIRKQVLPALRRINREAERNAVRSSILLANEDSFLSRQALDLLARSNWNDALPAMLDRNVFSGEPDVIVKRCATALNHSTGSRYTYRINETHIQALTDCLNGNRPFCPLPGSGKAIVKGHKILLLPGVSQADRLRIKELNGEGTFQIGAYSITVAFSPKNDHESDEILLANMFIRTRRPNDIFKDIDSSRSERLSEIFRRRRIPTEIRSLLPLIVNSDGEVIWISDPFCISEVSVCIDKNRCLKLTCKPISAIRC